MESHYEAISSSAKYFPLLSKLKWKYNLYFKESSCLDFLFSKQLYLRVCVFALGNKICLSKTKSETT